MARVLGNILIIFLLAAAMAFSQGCAEKSQVRVEGGQAGPRLADGVFRDPGLGVYWVSPQGWKPQEGGEKFLFGWQRPDRDLNARCLVLGADAEPMELVSGIAAENGYEIKRAEPVSWMGKSAAWAVLQGKGRTAVVRLTRSGDRVFALWADAPAGDFERRLVELGKALDCFRIVPPSDILHLVKRKSETLALVSLWYTGSAGNWPKLKRYNNLKEEALRPGLEIKVPREMVWRDDPLPPWAWRLATPASGSKKTRAKPAGKAPSAQEDDLEELKPTGPK